MTATYVLVELTSDTYTGNPYLAVLTDFANQEKKSKKIELNRTVTHGTKIELNTISNKYLLLRLT